MRINRYTRLSVLGLLVAVVVGVVDVRESAAVHAGEGTI